MMARMVPRESINSRLLHASFGVNDHFVSAIVLRETFSGKGFSYSFGGWRQVNKLRVWQHTLPRGIFAPDASFRVTVNPAIAVLIT